MNVHGLMNEFKEHECLLPFDFVLSLASSIVKNISLRYNERQFHFFLSNLFELKLFLLITENKQQ